jgi:hypothetical protein
MYFYYSYVGETCHGRRVLEVDECNGEFPILDRLYSLLT